ncbi:MAG: sugar ABC transporter substrate-binding protein [Haliangiales bacterium]
MTALFNVALPLLLTFAPAGCKSSESGQEPLIVPNERAETNTAVEDTAATAPKRIALIMKTLTNPFFVTMEKGAHRAERELGIELLVRTHGDETAIEQQIAIVKKAIADKVDAIVIVPGHSTEMIPVVKEAQDAGIKLVNVDNRLNPETASEWGLGDVPFVGVDNTQGAKLAAEHLVSQLDKPAEVAIIEGDPAAQTSKDRKLGALEAFEASEGVEVAAIETAYWKIDEAYRVARRLFEEHPDIRGIFCANDIMALGVIRYLEEADKLTDVLVAGYDNIGEAQDAIREGTMLATIDQRADEQGYIGVQHAVRALAGEKLPPETFIDVALVTSTSLKGAEQ